MCITKIDGTTIDDVEDLIMSMYNFLKHSSNYSDPTGSLRVYSKDEAANFNADIMNTENVTTFKYKAKLVKSTAANGIRNNHRAIKIYTQFLEIV